MIRLFLQSYYFCILLKNVVYRVFDSVYINNYCDFVGYFLYN